MNLIDENVEIEQDQNKKKMIKLIIILIGALILVAIILLVYTTIRRNSTLKLQIDNKNTDITSGLFYMSDGKNIYVDENNQIYVSVKKLSSLLGVEFYNDEYKNRGEDTTKCYIRTSNEYTSYISNSSQIYKAVIVEEQQDAEANTTTNRTTSNNTSQNNNTTQTVTEYEYFQTTNDVMYIDGEIYACEDAIELGFNVDLSYDQSTKTIKIYTLDALESLAANIVKNAVTGENGSYSNKKLLKYGLVLIQNGAGEYGIANYYNYSEGDYVLSCRYSNIRFIESSKTLIVTDSDSGNQGVLQLNLEEGKAYTKIDTIYQLITRMDADLDLYLVKENGRYGVIKIKDDTDSEEDDEDVEMILKVEYQQIGIDNDVYDEMNNKYIIADKYIPIKIDNLWGLASIEGDILIIPQYAGIGCDLAETGDGVILLPELSDGNDGIVFLTDAEKNLYSIINVKTGTRIGLNANEIYSRYENNTRNYYMKYSVTDAATMRDIDIYRAFGNNVRSDNNSNSNNTTTNSISTNNTTSQNVTRNEVLSNNTINNTAR